MASDKEEWEEAEHQLSELTIAPARAPQSGPRVMARPAPAPAPAPVPVPVAVDEQGRRVTPPVLTIPTAQEINGEPVDPAVFSALKSNKERMNALYFENVILSFVRSPEMNYEIPPMQNSFKRLLVYRIAQRFRVGHCTSDMVTQNGERGILLYKTDTTLIPRPLLVDIPVEMDAQSPGQGGPVSLPTLSSSSSGMDSYPYSGGGGGGAAPAVAHGGYYRPVSAVQQQQPQSSYKVYHTSTGAPMSAPPPPQAPVQSMAMPVSSTGPTVSAPGPGPGPGPGALKVMKRTVASNQSDSRRDSNLSSKVAAAAVDKEKAYAEAKARIFGESGGASTPPIESGAAAAALPGESAATGAATGDGSSFSVSDPSLMASSSGKSTSSFSSSSTGTNSPRGEHSRSPAAQPVTELSSSSSSPSPLLVSSPGAVSGGSKKDSSADPQSPAPRVVSGGSVGASRSRQSTPGAISSPSPPLRASSDPTEAGGGTGTGAEGRRKDVKYTVRDKEAEKADPDFSREAAVSPRFVPAAAAHHPPQAQVSYGAAPGHTSHSYARPQYQQQHHQTQHHQQQPVHHQQQQQQQQQHRYQQHGQHHHQQQQQYQPAQHQQQQHTQQFSSGPYRAVSYTHSGGPAAAPAGGMYVAAQPGTMMYGPSVGYPVASYVTGHPPPPPPGTQMTYVDSRVQVQPAGGWYAAPQGAAGPYMMDSYGNYYAVQASPVPYGHANSTNPGSSSSSSTSDAHSHSHASSRGGGGGGGGGGGEDRELRSGDFPPLSR